MSFKIQRAHWGTIEVCGLNQQWRTCRYYLLDNNPLRLEAIDGLFITLDRLLVDYRWHTRMPSLDIEVGWLWDNVRLAEQDVVDSQHKPLLLSRNGMHHYALYGGWGVPYIIEKVPNTLPRLTINLEGAAAEGGPFPILMALLRAIAEHYSVPTSQWETLARGEVVGIQPKEN